MTTEPTVEEIESLFINNEGLQAIQTYLNRFNPIRVMKMEGMEIRHSAVLAWLLDPQETHGFGDHFLKAFLAEAMRGRIGEPTALDISQADMRDAEIRREWKNIDIFILSRSNRWAFIIENKFYARQREEQLADYARKVKDAFKDQEEEPRVRGVFLTLLDEEPQDLAYAPIRYVTICELLSRMITQRGQSIGGEVATFLRHYLDIIKEAAGMSDEKTNVEELARQLYRNHKKVLDFIIEHGASTDFVTAMESLVGSNPRPGTLFTIELAEFIYFGDTTRRFSFVPRSWCDAFGGGQFRWPGCEAWWAGYPLICWLELFESSDSVKGQLKLVSEVGPISDQNFRAGLIEAIKTADVTVKRIKFQKGAADEGKKFSRFLKDNSVDITDIHDAEEIADAMKTLLRRFKSTFEAVAKVIPQFRQYGEPMHP